MIRSDSIRTLILLIGFLSFVCSCLKLPKIIEEETTPIEIGKYQQTILEAWGNVTPLDINVSELVQFNKTVALVGGSPKLMSQELQVITNSCKSTQSQNRKNTMLITQREFNDSGGFNQFSKEDDFEIPTALIQEVSTYNFSFYQLMMLLNVCSPGPGYNVTCHKLEVRRTKEPLPAGVARPECEGLTDCHMQVTNIEFELLLRNFDKEKGSDVKEKFIYRVRISPDLPALSRISSLCYQGLLKSGDVPFVAEICNQVYTFAKGTPPLDQNCPVTVSSSFGLIDSNNVLPLNHLFHLGHWALGVQ